MIYLKRSAPILITIGAFLCGKYHFKIGCIIMYIIPSYFNPYVVKIQYPYDSADEDRINEKNDKYYEDLLRQINE